jgi:hypothetical protein
MTCPFFKSSLTLSEYELENVVSKLVVVDLKRELLSKNYFTHGEITNEIDIELFILGLAIFSIHKPEFITNNEAIIIDQTCVEIITYLSRYYPKNFSTLRDGQIAIATTKFENYKKELLHCINNNDDFLPLQIYSCVFHFPLQDKIVEKDIFLDQILDFKNALKKIIEFNTKFYLASYDYLNLDQWFNLQESYWGHPSYFFFNKR